ncbi:hypothetical protein [Teredinibacter turnerae]|uniref:hypothetical protein n=1 Tax=Teredinibacter turnerae TaxID=2426 RepID=UPI00035D5BC5|nr:hypothetical protein [Teredinibacter turnerae]
MKPYQKDVITNPAWQIKFGAAFGVVFIVAVLAMILMRPELSAEEYAIIKTVMALAASGIAGVFTGFLEISGTITKVTVRTGGALALFVIVFFFTPEPPKKLKESVVETHPVINMNAAGEHSTQIGIVEGVTSINSDGNQNSIEKDEN